MTTLTDPTVENLQNLIRVNIDSCKGFEQAADIVSAPELETLFRDIAKYRQRHADELRRMVEFSDEDAAHTGKAVGTIHRWWLAARGALNGGDMKVILIELERSEDHIKAQYEKAIQDTAGSSVNSVLTKQFAEIKGGHDRIRDLRNAAMKT